MRMLLYVCILALLPLAPLDDPDKETIFDDM